MFLLLLAGAVGSAAPGDYYGLLLGVVLAAGLGAAALVRLAPRPWETLLGALALEELVAIAGLLGPYPELLFVPGRALFLFLPACLVAALLLLRAPLPEALFPVRGRWLRKLLAAGALLGLLQAGPWGFLWQELWSSSHLRAGAALGLLLGLWMALLAGRVLTSGLPPLRTARTNEVEASGAAGAR